MHIFTCPKGHIVSEDKLKCVVSLIEPDIDKATIFICDAGPKTHEFILRSAIRSKMFTPDHVERIREEAEKHRKKHGYKPKGES